MAPEATTAPDVTTVPVQDAVPQVSAGSCCGGGHATVDLPDPSVDAAGPQAEACCGSASDADHAPYGYADHKQDYLRRLRRIEGQVRGLQRMVDEDQYCIDILTQISAVTKALESTALRLLDEHLSHCVSHAISAGGQDADDKLAEASAAIARLVRS